jgi:hypothetical protein
MIVGGLNSSTSRRRYCKDSHEVKLIHTKPSQPLRWSEPPITFSRADHWVHILDPSSYPLVVKPIAEGALLAQTLIDGGSGLNVIFVDTSATALSTCFLVSPFNLSSSPFPLEVLGGLV